LAGDMPPSAFFSVSSFVIVSVYIFQFSLV